MRRHSDIDDRDLERLFAGQAIDGNGELEDLAAFFEGVRRAFPEGPTGASEKAHVASMMQAVELLTENGDPVARPASKAYGSETQTSGLPKWRTNVRTLIASTKFKVAAGVVAMLMLFSGTAFAAAGGHLPAVAQNAVSSAAQVVGVNVPTAAEAKADHEAEISAPETPDPSTEATADENTDNQDETAVEATDAETDPAVEASATDQVDQDNQSNVDEQAAPAAPDAPETPAPDAGATD